MLTHDQTHEMLLDRIQKLTRRMVSLEEDLMALKDAFYQHAHVEEDAAIP